MLISIHSGEQPAALEWSRSPVCLDVSGLACVHISISVQVKLNRGLDFVQLDDLLVDLKLTPDVLEVPVPRYFIEDRAKVSSA